MPSPLRSILLSLPLLAAATFSPAQQPPTIAQSLGALADQPATHASFAFDRSMLQIADGFLNGPGGATNAAINSVTVETFHYAQPAFYTPEGMHDIIASYDRAGWKHLVNANASPGRSAQPDVPITDLWLHFHGTEIDDVTVLLRGPRSMNFIQLSGMLRPLDLLHLAGHFGIPKVDPNAVMVPAPPGR